MDHRQIKYESLREDEIFWARLSEMPWLEAEEECVKRKENLNLQIAMLLTAKNESRSKNESERIGREIQALHQTHGMLTDKIKWYRTRLSQVTWQRAVTAIWGKEGYDACRDWMVANEVFYNGRAAPLEK